MADYGDLAKGLIQKYLPSFGSFGTTVLYRSMGAMLYNPDTGQTTPSPIVEFDIYGIIIPFSQTANQSGNRQFDDIVVLSVDRKIILAAADMAVEARVADQVEFNGETWRVIGVQADPKPAHYSLHIRPSGVVA